MSTHVYIYIFFCTTMKKKKHVEKIEKSIRRNYKKKVEMKIQKKNTENSNSLSGIQQSAVVICGACRSTLYNIYEQSA